MMVETDWQERFDACLERLREIDEAETKLRREFVADMRAQLNAEWEAAAVDGRRG